MMTNKGFSHAPPDKANELFDKLLATLDSAIKIRERLFKDLKEELELLATLQEEHLFPVLDRHGMQDLVRDATNDNQETSSLLLELERMPKDSAEFKGKVGELKRVFQQHIRDDKKELLPAVLKVLSDEEANAVVERVEEEMANIDDTRLAGVRRAGEQVGTVQRVTEDAAETMKAGVEGAQTVLRIMQEAMVNSVRAASELTRRSTGQALQMFGRPDRDAAGRTEEASHNLGTVAQSGTAFTRGLQDVSEEVFERSQQRLQRNLDGLQALARCRSMTDLVEVQSTLLRDNLELTVENSRRIAELTIQMTGGAADTVTVSAEKTAQRVSRAA
jgi:hypothetical protein